MGEGKGEKSGGGQGKGDEMMVMKTSCVITILHLMSAPLALFGARVTPLPPLPCGTLTNDVSFGWQDGAIIWYIPLGWNEHGTSGETDPIKTNAVPERQTFIITTNGTLSVIKAGWYVSRGTNTQIRSGRMQR